jgi:hypothetical protein
MKPMTDEEARDFVHGYMTISGSDCDRFMQFALQALADRKALVEAMNLDTLLDMDTPLRNSVIAARRHMEGNSPPPSGPWSRRRWRGTKRRCGPAS